jgi:hypothetical protein
MYIKKYEAALRFKVSTGGEGVHAHSILGCDAMWA